MKNIYKIISLLIFNCGVLVFGCFSQAPPGIEWQNTIGGSQNDLLYSIAATPDGGCIAGGYSYSDSSGDKTENHIGSTGTCDYWIVKLDSSGNLQWQNT